MNQEHKVISTRTSLFAKLILLALRKRFTISDFSYREKAEDVFDIVVSIETANAFQASDCLIETRSYAQGYYDSLFNHYAGE